MYTVHVQTSVRPQAKVELVPITTLEEHAALERAATGDRHRVIVPTHMAMRGSEVIGYVSAGVVPLLFGWVHTQKATPQETFKIWREAEAAMHGKGLSCLPVTDTSPLLKFAGKMGYDWLGTAHLHLKSF